MSDSTLSIPCTVPVYVPVGMTEGAQLSHSILPCTHAVNAHSDIREGYWDVGVVQTGRTFA